MGTAVLDHTAVDGVNGLGSIELGEDGSKWVAGDAVVRNSMGAEVLLEKSMSMIVLWLEGYSISIAARAKFGR